MTDAQLKQITDRLDKIAHDVYLMQVRSNTLVNSQMGKLAADVDRLADEVAGKD